MNNNLSPLAEHLMQTIIGSNGELPDLLNFLDLKYIRELNETYPSLFTYKIKRQFGLLRLYDPILESELRLLDIKELEDRLNALSKEPRYKQLKRLREENNNPEFKFIYGDYPVESDDVVSYMQGMSLEEIYERRKKIEIVLMEMKNSFLDSKNRKQCPIYYY
jgi:hypothetical protein